VLENKEKGGDGGEERRRKRCTEWRGQESTGNRDTNTSRFAKSISIFAVVPKLIASLFSNNSKVAFSSVFGAEKQKSADFVVAK
jgi:hypothetical protein